MKTANEHNDCDNRESHAEGAINSVEGSILWSGYTQPSLLVTYSQSAAIV